ncbi:MAG: peptidoglycan DD-metalloendopeptidase family protein [Synechococcales bacterium]|nr:peptidoglycan DD-metalloendopeptidase family protein [Synechococcales bacterium]
MKSFTRSWLGRWLGVICLGLLLAGAIAPSHSLSRSPAPLASRLGGTVPLEMAQADSVDTLRQQQQQIEQKRDNLQQERDRLENLEGQAQDRLESLESTIETTEDQVTHNEQQLAIAKQRLTDLQDDLAIAEQAYQDRQYATTRRLRFLQRQKIGQGWAVLLQSEDLNEFLDRRRQLTLVYQADRQILAHLRQEADALEQRRRRIEDQKNEIALMTQQLLLQKAEYEAQASEQQKLVARLREDRKALEEAEARLIRDSENLEGLIRQRIAAAQGIVRGTGRLVFPTNGGITSQFGYRRHPILGYNRFHAGVDFGASHGTTIRAADAGRVIFAGWYGGYGYAVIINHGDSLTTLYGHASQLYVSEGMDVQQGQAIAAVGSTGLSTGPHLHFEVRLNGTPVNPLEYL